MPGLNWAMAGVYQVRGTRFGVRTGRHLFTFLILAAALALPFAVFEKRVEPFHCVYHTCRWDGSVHLLISLGSVTLPTKPDQPGRLSVEHENGIFVKRGLSLPTGIGLGVVAPIVLLIWVLTRTLRMPRPSA
ncbi:MAG TPA: hypothetical protein VKB71_06425 [Rhizomicrobium sp.]|nr:hypothetical protein [Rhizomicrobium sp.]